MNMGVGVQIERGLWWGWWRGSCGLVGGGFESRSDGREQGGREMTAERSAEAGESDFGSELGCTSIRSTLLAGWYWCVWCVWGEVGKSVGVSGAGRDHYNYFHYHYYYYVICTLVEV